MEIKLIKFLIILERLLCIHKSMSGSSYVTRFIIYGHITLDISLIIANQFKNYATLSQFQRKTEDMLFFLLSSICSVAVILISVYKSKKYEEMINKIEINHLQMKSSPDYNKKLNIAFIVIAGASLVIVLTDIIGLLSGRVMKLSPVTGTYFTVVLYYAGLIACDYRFTISFFDLSSTLYIMSEQLTFIANSVNEFKVVKKETKPDTKVNDKVNVCDNWCASYTNVKESSKLFNDVYGVQLTIMVSTIVMYYIIFLYSLTSISVKGTTDLVERGLYVFSLGLFLINLTMLSFAAQRAQNRAEILKRSLSKLLLQSLGNEDYYKSTKDLLRLVSTSPIKTEAFGSINVDMSLLPTCVLFFTYYTVIALQFNNVV